MHPISAPTIRNNGAPVHPNASPGRSLNCHNAVDLDFKFPRRPVRVKGRPVTIKRRIAWVMFLCFCADLPAAQSGQAGSSQPTAAEVSLQDVVQSALRDYPQIHISQEELNASIANIRLARTAYLPRADGLLQVNRATRNNVFGAVLPQSIIPPISGPVIGSNNAGSVWGSATGLLVSWQPFDFGLRHANVVAATAARERDSSLGYRTPDEFRRTAQGNANVQSKQRFPGSHSLGGDETISTPTFNREHPVMNG